MRRQTPIAVFVGLLLASVLPRAHGDGEPPLPVPAADDPQRLPAVASRGSAGEQQDVTHDNADVRKDKDRKDLAELRADDQDLRHDKGDIRADNRDLTRDKADVRADNKDVARDKADVQKDGRDLAHDRADLRADQQDLRKDKAGLRADRADLRADRQDLRSNPRITAQNQQRNLTAQNDVRNANGQVGTRGAEVNQQARQPGMTATTLANETANQQQSKPPATHPVHQAWYHWIIPW